ncbi:putative porin [Pseudomonas sp. HR96]|uniref:putative porin n=1 Tax=Pseudomonas sp. HR96 TaxID=1027966 RepID=UPI002A75849D|nr:putative porin [Pseudomonas sp. HR96]WPP01187.1 putative porin [Pseudomonas sp. HR96]
MRLLSTFTGIGLCSTLLMAMSTPANAAVDAKLLAMLKANGSITDAQYAELQADLANDQKVTQQATADAVAKQNAWDQKVAWASKTRITGDVRVREENIKTEGSTLDNNRTADRQRVRARFGVYSEIDPQVDAGIRVATGGSADSRSTNQDLNNGFTKKSLWLDEGYLDWHPTAIKNLHLIGGKMLQPWVSMGDIIWDSDVNPEGVAATYKLPINKNAELFGSIGYYTLKDNVDGEGYQFNHDLSLYAGQLGGKFNLGDVVGVTAGGSIYNYNNSNDDGTAAGTTVASNGTTTTRTLIQNGNTTNEFKLYELFGQVDIKTLPIPLAVYGQYVHNGASTDGADEAWLAGIKSKLGAFSVDYNYRDVQKNGVVGAFTDSDFANGYTGSRGHKIKLGYDIDKNFGLGVTYFLAKTDTAVANRTDVDLNTLQLDLEAKF